MADSTSRSELSYEQVVDAADYVKEQLKGFRPRVGIVCGSGLGEVTSILDTRNLPSVLLSDLPRLEYLKPSVGGHSGKLLFGYVHNLEVMIAEGRVHPYEGHTHLQCAFPILLMRKLGVTHVILTNASGSMNSEMKVGSLMLIKDQIDLPGICGSNPLFGVCDPRFFSNEFGPGSRFIAVANCYDQELQRLAMQVAKNELKFTTDEINEGIYCRVAGPYYETLAEVALLRKAFGGDVVGMSTTYEAIIAFQCSMKVLGITVVTDMCDDVANVSHQKVIEAAKAGSSNLAKLISKFIELELVRLQPPTDAAGEEELQQHS